jgi:hypothetical protein
MQQVAATARSPAGDRKIYAVWIGMVWAAILAGFGMDFARYLGLAAALVDQVRQITHPDYAPQFLALEFEEMIAFSIFMTAGVIFRRDPAAHKRLMILSAVAISDAGFARIWQLGIKTEIPGLFGWPLEFFWGIFLILVAMAAWDLWRRRRIHPAVLFGAAVLWTGEIIVTILNFSPTWHDMMVRLVNAWGYAG